MEKSKTDKEKEKSKKEAEYLEKAKDVTENGDLSDLLNLGK